MSLEGGWGRIGLRPLSALLPHEDTIPPAIQQVTDELKADGVQKDPLIVDSDSGVVLDGMHRLAALTRLGLQYAVCCSVDYSSRGISVGRWARVYAAPSGAKVQRVLAALGMAKVNETAAIDSLESRESPAAVLNQDGCYLVDRGADLAKGFTIIRSIDELSLSLGWKRTFVPEDEIDVPLQSKSNVVALVSRIRKQDVIEAGTKKSLFPCKTSMHVIDPRPVGANVPLDELETGSRKSVDSLNKSRHPLLPANSVYGGRRYKERLVVLREV